jgi:hypothetical protein
VDADVRDGMDGPNRDQRLNNLWPLVFRIDDARVRLGSTSHRDRHHVLTRIARLQMRRRIVLDAICCRPMMLVGGEPVMVVGMIVIGVQMDVQRRALAGGKGQNERRHDRDQAMHKAECM